MTTSACAGHDWLYAVGDVNGRALLTHMGKYQGRVCADRILGHDVQLLVDGVASPGSSSPTLRSAPSV